PGTSDPGRISYSNITLRRVLLSAYEVKSYQISGPDWLDTARFDITAKLPAATTKEQFQAMMRNLLETRFRMKVHRESRDLPIYALLISKNGPKIKPQMTGGPSDKSEQDQLAAIREGETK